MRFCKWLGVLVPLLAAMAACDDFSLETDPAHRDSGQLCWVLDHSVLTKSSPEEIPDTNDFLLTIRNAEGRILYEGKYGDSPQALDVEEGYYTVSIISVTFDNPAFARPQYGDEQVVKVPKGQSVTVRLCCSLKNAGIRLRTGPDFLEAYPDGILFVKQGSAKLKYQYRETRVAYIKPGSVSVLLNSSGQDQTLFTRDLEAREILTVKISAPEHGNGKSSISVQTDTTKLWEDEYFVIGGGSGGGNQNPGSSYSVADAFHHSGEEGVWVTGYIVGGDLTTAGKTVKTNGITKNTHLALADRSSVTDKASCLAVELPAGKVRETLNLVDHPGLIGKRVSVKGNLVEKYFGTAGMKSTSAHEFR